MFEPARQNKTTDIIIEKIRAAILDGKLRPGDRLPPEKELGEQFDVSKQTIRESLRALEYLGLITIRKGAGGGAFIVEVEKKVAVQNLANYLYFKNLSIENLSETRRILEPYAARCAVRSMSDEDLMVVHQINERTEDSINRKDWQQVTLYEVEFHKLIASQTGNPILILAIDFVENLLEDFKTILKPDSTFMHSVLESHKQIYEALRDRNEDRAAAEMEHHIIQVESHLAQLKRNKQGSRLWQNCLLPT